MVSKINLMLVALALLFASNVNAQVCSQYCFSEEEVQTLANEMRTLQQRDSLNRVYRITVEEEMRSRDDLHLQDSLLIGSYQSQVGLLNNRIGLQEQQIRILERQRRPVSRLAWFSLGVSASAIVTSVTMFLVMSR